MVTADNASSRSPGVQHKRRARPATCGRQTERSGWHRQPAVTICARFGVRYGGQPRHAWGVSHLVWEATLPDLRSPLLVTAYQGWFDVGGAATGALEWLSERSDSIRVAHIDPEEFFNFAEQRPTVRLRDARREIEWPANDVHVLRPPEARHDLMLVVGAEPQLRWRTYAEVIVELAKRCAATALMTVGAHVADIPHTRPFDVTGSTTDAGLADVWGLGQPSYEGPTGIVGVLHERFEQIGVPAASLRVAVPHYVSGAPNPKGARALLERFERVTGLPTGWADLDDAAAEWEQRVNDAMHSDDDVVAYVKRLEARADARAKRNVPSGDDLGAEFERFLRQQDTSG